jgi:hypothetical protein
MTRKEMTAELDALGIEYAKTAKNEVLAELIEANSNVTPEMRAVAKAAEDALVVKEPVPVAAKTLGQLKAAARKVAEKKVRVIITAMDKDKAELSGEIISCGNSMTGMLKEFIPFGKEWHVRQIIVDTLKEKKMWSTRDRKTKNGTIKENIEIPQYNVQLLEDLSQDELDRLVKEGK